jgi:hypothetical protein
MVDTMRTEDAESAIISLLNGNPPDNPEIIGRLTAGISFLTDFWREKYLLEYIKPGGSKIKFLTGSPGSGKSHCLELFLKQAADEGFAAVSLDAKTTRLDDFKEIYCSIYDGADLPAYLGRCAEKIISEMGFIASDIPEEISFADYLAGQGLLDPITKREIRFLLNKMFMQNPMIDNNFALCCSLLTGELLGHPTLEANNRELLLSWLSAGREHKLSDYRKIGLSPARITKQNARHMLRSLVEIIKLSGYGGLVVGFDNLEALIAGSGLDTIRYTKQRREDAYECIRELIDEIDTLRNIMFVFAFDSALAEDENAGLKSYQALWMRIQNEIEGERFNRFCDMANLDRLAAQEYGGATIAAISASLADVVNAYQNQSGREPIVPLDEDSADMFIEHSRAVNISVPRKVSRMTFKERGSVIIW